MGNIVQSACIDLADLPEDIIKEYENTRLTVTRTNGAIEDNWHLSRVPHQCALSVHEGLSWAAAHAFEIMKPDSAHYHEWKIWLYSNEPVKHICGWRRLSTIWPTHLTTAKEREEWQRTLKSRLDSLRAIANVKNRLCI
jgi:hypothetical protein